MIDKRLAPASMQSSEDQIDVRRYLDALRRSAPFILFLVVTATVATVLTSKALPDRYDASARLVFEESSSPLGPTDSDAVFRELSTIGSLLTTPQVLERAGRKLGLSASTVDERVSSEVDDTSNLVTVRATDTQAKRAADIANAVSEAFIAERTQAERRRLERARQSLLSEIDALEGSPNSDVQIAAIRERISQLTVAQASAGSELQLAERAATPGQPTSPRPLRNGVLAFIASLFLAVLLVLGRELLTSRVASARELSRLTRLTVLAGVPYVRSWRGRRSRYASAAEDEAYQTLRAWVELERPPEGTRVILVTSAVHSEGKTTATARLGQALSEAGYGVLLVSGDLRRPRLHALFGVGLEVGLADAMDELSRADGADEASQVIERAIVQISPAGAGDRGHGELSLMTSGSDLDHGVHALTSDTARAFFSGARTMGFDYILVDGPPLLGIADSTILAQEANDIIVVARLDRVTLESAVDLREMLGRLPTQALGLVVIGTPSETSPYYLPRRTQPLPGRPAAKT